jgi:hypothetical protein
MPTAEKTFFRRPPQAGHSVRASSVNFCTASRPSPHSVHWYWYVGTVFLLALSLDEC